MTIPGNPTPIVTNTTRNFSDVMSGQVGFPVVPSPFVSTQRKNTVRANGRAITTNGYLYDFAGYPIIGNHAIGDGSIVQLAPPSGWLLDLVAGTNPSRPVLTIPEMIQNLVELPRLIRDTGFYLLNPKKVAKPTGLSNAYLGAKFGWLPLIGDLQKLMNVNDYAFKRVKEMNQLYSGRGLRRRLRFAQETTTHEGLATHAMVGINRKLDFPLTTVMSKTTWATIRWKPIGPPPYLPGDDKQFALARRLVLGLTPEGVAQGAWKVIPWTWLLGWATNVGKFTLANSNTVPASWYGACFMSMVDATTSASSPIPSGTNFCNVQASGTLQKTVRTRIVGSGVLTPGFSIPFLDMDRLSVLSALAIQRFKR